MPRQRVAREECEPAARTREGERMRLYKSRSHSKEFDFTVYVTRGSGYYRVAGAYTSRNLGTAKGAVLEMTADEAEAIADLLLTVAKQARA